jgi:NAD+ diphosphatase
VKAALEAPSSRFMMLVDLKPAVTPAEAGGPPRLRWWSTAEIAHLGLADHASVLLGLDASGAAHFSLALTEHRARVIPGGPFCLRPYVELRSLAVEGLMAYDELAIAGQARAMAEWHLNSRCCGHCGSTTDIKDAGWRRKCWSCKRDHFPRTDPVVIMLVTFADKALLGHEARFQGKMYSALAGFLEHGEDIEHAVRREVKEEAGLDVGAVRYQESQPWPFPHSLMIGCRAEALHSNISIGDHELLEARWFARDELSAMLEKRHPEGLIVPGPHAIAYKLITAFVRAGG